MRKRNARHLLICGALVLGLAPALPIFAAASPGRLKLADPVAQHAYSDEVPFRWTWSGGTKIASWSKVYLQASTDGSRWYTIRSNVPIRNGSYTWDTAGWPEAVYAVRTVVHKTQIGSVVNPIVIDRTAPGVHITNPSEGDIIVEDQLRVFAGVVVGTTNLEAATYDSGTGVEELTWTLDGEAICSGSPCTYNFSMKPGRHELTATAEDYAGNASSHTVIVIAGPGPSLAMTDDLPPLPDDGDLPDTGDVPAPPDGVPNAPEVPGAPNPDDVPEAPPAPNPDDAPDAPPAPNPDPDDPPAPPSVPGGIPDLP